MRRAGPGGGDRVAGGGRAGRSNLLDALLGMEVEESVWGRYLTVTQ